jgi:tetratricopeptide (TPR) repeat protein/serine/threonine protein kinase
MHAEFQRVKEIFLAAVDKPDPVERDGYLHEVCGQDEELRRRVDALLSKHERAGSFLESPAPSPVATVDEPPVREQPGTVIGPFKLLQQIGEGGFGVVFLADQTQPVRRKVALKVLKPGMDTRQVVARFEAERQALAIMDHPNIAKVFDGGATPSGRPYFVMELVKGVPITEFCDQNHLTPRQRLELFISACQAVQHAHQKGIIHRDLKPSNVLVSRHDTTPVVKVIDFGVAKALGQELTDKTLFTSVAQMVGTPLYMSPEQAGMSDLDVDTRSDVYSLGVLLYELLTGTTPFTKERFKLAGYDEIRRIIREEEPPKPSTRLSEAKDSLPAISAQRHTEPAKLTKLVRGELDWIVMKALEKDRNRRYETANGFATDVQRYLTDEPVLACPPTAAYRLRKFARRNKGGLAVAGLALFFLALLGSGAGWAWRDWAARQANVAGQVESILAEVDRLEGEQKWAEALAAARRAEAAAAGGAADAATARQVRARVKDLTFLDRLEQIRMQQATWVERAFDNAGAVRGYGRAFREYDVNVEELPVETSVDQLKARPALAIPLAAALDGWVDAQWVVAGNDAAGWKVLVAVARGIDPEPLRDRLRATWGQPLSSQLRDELCGLAQSIAVGAHHPTTLVCLARTLQRSKDSDAALRLLRDGQHVYPGDFWLNFELAAALGAQEDYEGAIRFYTAAVSIRPHSTAVHNNLGTMLAEQKKLDEAITCYQKAIEIDSRHAIAHYNIGNALHDQKKLDEAIACYRKAIEFDPKYAAAYGNLGYALRDQKKLDEAVAAYRKAIELDPKHAKYHHNLGLALRDQKKLPEALAAYRKAIELAPKYANAYGNLGALLCDGLKEYDKAVECFRKAIELDPRSALAHSNLGTALRGQKKLDEAITCYQKAIEIDSRHAIAHFNLGNALHHQKKLDEAIACYRKAIEFDPKYANAYYNLGVVLGKQEKWDEAVATYRKAVEIDSKYALAYYNLGNALSEQKKLDEAIAAFRKAIELDPTFATAYCNLGIALRDQKQLGEAVAASRKAVELDPKNVAAHNNLGVALRDQQKLDGAIACYRKAIELDPKYVAAYTNLGSALLEQKKLDEAVAAHRKAVELDPKYAIAHHNLGVALGEQKKWDEAVAAYRKAIDLDPKYFSGYNDLGVALYAQKKWPDAIDAFRKAIDHDPKFALAQDNLGGALAQQGKLDDAIFAFRKAIELDPKYATAYSNLGGALAQQRKLDDALAAFRKSIELDPKSTLTAQAHFQVGKVLEVQGKLNETIACFKKAVELDPQLDVAHNALAWLLTNCREVKLRDSQQALEVARKAVELAPRSGFAWQMLGWAHYRARDWKASIEALEKSCALDDPKGGDAAQWFFLAMAHWQLKEKDKAGAWYDRAVQWMDKHQPKNEDLSRFRAEAAELLEVNEKK